MDNSKMQNDAMKKPEEMKKAPIVDPLNKTLKGAGETRADDGEPEENEEHEIGSPAETAKDKHRDPMHPESDKH